MSAIDNQLAELLGKNADLYATYEEWANGQIMLLAGTVDDPDSYDAQGGKIGPLGYYPIVNVSGQTIYVPCIARLKAIASDVPAATIEEAIAGVRTDRALTPQSGKAAIDNTAASLLAMTGAALDLRPRVDADQAYSADQKKRVRKNTGSTSLNDVLTQVVPPTSAVLQAATLDLDEAVPDVIVTGGREAPGDGGAARYVRSDVPTPGGLTVVANSWQAPTPTVLRYAIARDEPVDLGVFGWRKNGGQFNDQYVDDVAEALQVLRHTIECRDPEARYLPSKTLSVSGGARMNGNGATILHQTDQQLFNFTAAYIYGQAIVGPIDNAAKADLALGATSVLSDVAVVPVEDASAYPVGCWVKIFDNSLNPGVRASDGNRKAEYSRVAGKLSGNRLVLSGRLRDTYVASPRIARLNDAEILNIRRFVLNANGVRNNVGAWIFTGFLNPHLHAMIVRESQDQAFRFVGCANLDISNIWGGDAYTAESPGDAAGYLLAFVACQGALITHIGGYNLRHGFTPSPGRVADADLNDRTRDFNRGKTRDIEINGFRALFCQGAFIDAHDDGENIHASNGLITFAFNGPVNTDYAIGFRGMNNRATNIVIEGGSGIWLFTDATDGVTMGGHRLSTITYRGGGVQDKEAYGIRVSGTTQNPVNNNIVRAFSAEISNTAWGAIRGAFGELTLIDADVKYAGTSGGTGKMVRVGANFALRVERGHFDFTGTAAGASARFAKWDSDATGSSVIIEDARFTTPAISAVAALFDLSGLVGTAIARRVTSNLRTGFAEGHTGAAAPAVVNTTNGSPTLAITSGSLVKDMPVIGANIPGGTRITAVADDGLSATMSANATATATGVNVTQSRVSVDIKTTEYGASQPGVLHLDITAANGFSNNWRLTLDLAGRGQDKVVVNIRTDLTGGAISGMMPGANIGQTILIRNLGTSAQSFAVWRAPSSRLNLVANVTLAPFQRQLLEWDGNNGVEA